MTKVLVFESDHAFAGELRTELSRLGCTVSVVDDGNVGLQTASSDPPQLILLSIELPRMNGFSVCNKLKKDPLLKDIPLIIMSSESSDDTFEQHKKLRTRAEDYVHKPIALGELLEHIRKYVAIGAGRESDAESIMIDDAIELVDEENEATDSHALDAPPPPMPVETAQAEAPRRSNRPPKEDREIDDFLGGAFDRLLDNEETKVPDGPSPRPAPVSVRPPPPDIKRSVPPPPPPIVKRSNIPPAPNDEADKLRADLTRQKDENLRIVKQLAEANASLNRLQGEMSAQADPEELSRLQREVDDLKHRLTSQASSGKGGVSSKEFLDLREALNKKDKELLGLRQEMSRKDKELIELRDQSLSLERERSDQVDKLLELERAKGDLESIADALRADKDLAVKRGEEFKQKLEKATQTIAARDGEVAQLKQAASDQAAAHQEATDAADKAHRDAISAAEQRHAAAMSAAKADHEAKLAATLDAAAREKASAEEAARAAREAMQSQHDAAVADLHEARTRAVSEANEAKARELAESREAATQALLTRERELEQKRETALAEQRAAHQRSSDDAAADFAQQKGRFEAEIRALTERFQEATAKIADGDAARAALESDLGETRKRLTTTEGSLEIRTAERDELKTERDTTAAELEKRTTDLAKSRERAETAEEKCLELEAQLKARNAELDKSKAEGAALREEVETLSSSISSERARLEKARVKWGEDRASLDRAKEALTAALAQIAETEQRPLE